MSSSSVNLILNILSNSKEENIPLMYETYRQRFNIKLVPPVEVAGNKDKKASMVWINRLQAIEYLKNNHNFIEKKDLRKELEEAANDRQMG